MTKFLEWVGGIVLLVLFLGAIDFIDVHVSITDPSKRAPHNQAAISVVENGAQIEVKTSEPRADTGFDSGDQCK
jgi:hypothetical protein